MKIKIVNQYLFMKNNGIIGHIAEKEYKVYAICEEKKLFRKQKKFLIILFNSLIWIKESKETIMISDNRMENNWIFTHKHHSGYRIHQTYVSYYQDIRLKNLYAYKWMLDDKRFFLEVLEEPEIAFEKFKLNLKNNINE